MEFFEKLERKKRLKIKSDKKHKHVGGKDRSNREVRGEEDIKLKYKKQYFQHRIQREDEEGFM